MTTCPCEPEIAAAVRSGAWTNELRAHLAGCGSCAETALLAGALCAACDATLAEVPEPGLLWWKMQLRARRDAVETAERPILWAERSAAGVGLVALAWAFGRMGNFSTEALMMVSAALFALGATAAGVVFFDARVRRGRRRSRPA